MQCISLESRCASPNRCSFLGAEPSIDVQASLLTSHIILALQSVLHGLPPLALAWIGESGEIIWFGLVWLGSVRFGRLVFIEVHLSRDECNCLLMATAPNLYNDASSTLSASTGIPDTRPHLHDFRAHTRQWLSCFSDFAYPFL